MTGLRPLAARALFILMVTYLIIGGGTLAGILLPPYKIVTAALVLPALAVWLIVRWRKGWRWHKTALDVAIVAWIAAVLLSFAANTPDWRRMTIGMWYGGAFLVGWFFLQDILANRGFTRLFLVDALLLAGVLILVDCYPELFGLIRNWAEQPPETRIEFYNAVRVWGRLGNPNWVVTFTIMIVPMALARAFTVKARPARALIVLYAALHGVLGFFTFSRAGWIGLGVMAVAFAGLALATWQRAILERAGRWVAGLPGRWPQTVRWGGAALALVVAAVAILVLVRISLTGGRSLDDRLYMYNTAVAMLAEKPLTGHGLFTFGEGLLRYNSVPFRQAHGSAHNLFLNFAAELGLIGIIALALTVAGLLLGARRVWRTATSRTTPIILTGGLAALAGVAGQSFFDFTLATPAMFLPCLLILVAITAPEKPEPVGRTRSAVLTGGLAALCMALVGGALWSNNAYTRYLDALSQGAQANLTAANYASAARAMQGAIDADPAMPVYSLYQGIFYGLAAQRGDSASAPEAVRALERFVQLEPYFAPAWANLSVLYEQAGQPDAALDAARRAFEIAPKASPLGMRLGSLYEARGEMDAAREAYHAVLDGGADYALYPFWQETPLRREVAGAPSVTDKFSAEAQVLNLLAAGQDQAARERLDAAPPTDIAGFSRTLLEAFLPNPPATRQRLVDVFGVLAARGSFEATDIEALTMLGRAATACAAGKLDEAQAAAARVETLRGGIPFTSADATAGFYVQSQYYRIGLAPFFLPGDAWPVFGPSVERYWQLFQERYADCQ
ncbi:MAG: O-antigen ligase family protein [Anaerolineae bacterium]|nr:O-antigen ligase family protein [Anaerolineae bacterium]